MFKLSGRDTILNIHGIKKVVISLKKKEYQSCTGTWSAQMEDGDFSSLPLRPF